MKKTIFKELLIILLLTLVIVLTLRMVIYDFILSESTLPETIKYSADFTVQTVLSEIQTEEDNSAEVNMAGELLKSYMIEESDLKDYVSKSEYKNGKADPFSEYTETNKNSNNR